MTLNSEEQFIETVIVGGSLAGSSLARQLLLAGKRVCLIDRERFPRSKACGEGLSAAGLAQFEKLGLTKELTALPHREFTGYEVKLDGRYSVVPSLPVCGVNSSTSYGIRREVVDAMVLDSIRSDPNLLLLEGSTVVGIGRDREQFLTSYGAGTIRSTFLIAADGANSKVSEFLEPELQGTPGSTSYALSLWYSATVPIEKILIVVRDGYEIFFTPVGPSEINCSIVSSAPEIISRDRSLLLREIASEIQWRFGVTLPEPSLVRGVSLSPGRRRTSKTPNLIYVGDAAEVFDPICGMGMTHALISARLAAECLMKALPGADNEYLFRRYHRERDQVAREFRALTKIISLLLRRLPPAVANPALSSVQALLSLSPTFQRGAIQLLTGIAGG